MDSSNLKVEYDSNNVQQKQKIGCSLVNVMTILVITFEVYDGLQTVATFYRLLA